MNLRSILRENWDVAFLLIAMASILTWVLTVTLILPLMGD